MAYNSTLKRRTPFKRSAWVRKPAQPMKRTALKKVSKKQTSRHARYLPLSKAHLRANPFCAICIARGLGRHQATETHHFRGRAGALLFDMRFFVSSCFAMRLWPHDNTREARKLGLLSSAVDFNRSPAIGETINLPAHYS